jgi:ribosomal protein L7Ae-like RNA K-turn-binding protein
MERLIGLLHLSRKAGKLLLGQKAVLSLSSKNRQSLIIMAVDTGLSLRKKLAEKSTMTIRLSSDKLGEIFGRDRISVFGIADDNFAAEIKNILKLENLLVI